MPPVKRALEDLARLSDRELTRIFEAGRMPEAERLAGWEFRGCNPPLFAKLLGIQKFKKGFFWKSTGGERQLWGYNVGVEQNGLDAPWKNKGGDALPRRFGWYHVTPVDPGSKENLHTQALLLNYGEGDNPIWDGTGVLRDYVVQVDADNDDLYLGKAYVALGPIRIPTNFFILDRLRESDFSG